jgi:hypothetical protein
MVTASFSTHAVVAVGTPVITAELWARTKSAGGDELAAATANTKNTRTCE